MSAAADALDTILANNCPLTQEGDVYTFSIELHCSTVTVKARLISTMGGIHYEPISVTVDE
jgi:hypothetical protein